MAISPRPETAQGPPPTKCPHSVPLGDRPGGPRAQGPPGIQPVSPFAGGGSVGREKPVAPRNEDPGTCLIRLGPLSHRHPLTWAPHSAEDRPAEAWGSSPQDRAVQPPLLSPMGPPQQGPLSPQQPSPCRNPEATYHPPTGRKDPSPVSWGPHSPPTPQGSF